MVNSLNYRLYPDQFLLKASVLNVIFKAEIFPHLVLRSVPCLPLMCVTKSKGSDQATVRGLKYLYY